jgi:hypothetical protein
MAFPLHSKNPGRGLTLTGMRKRLGFFQKRRVPRAGYAETDSKYLTTDFADGYG